MSEIERCSYCTKKIVKDSISSYYISSWSWKKLYCDKQCFLWDREDKLFLENRTQLRIERIARIKFGWNFVDDEIEYWTDGKSNDMGMNDNLIERKEFKPYLETEGDKK
jgi:hypothetical protein